MLQTVLDGDGSSTPLWIDVCEPTPDELERLAQQHGIARAALEECTAPLHLPKHERLGETTFVITRVYDEESRPDAHAFFELTRKLAIFLGDRFLITIHRRRLPFLDALKERVRRASHPVYLQVLMLEILLSGVETYHEALEQAELRIHDFEESLLDEKTAGFSPAAWRDIFRTKVRI